MRGREDRAHYDSQFGARGAVLAVALFAALASAGCGAEEPDPSPPCTRECRDGNALQGLRETLKLAYNLTLQGNSVGQQDETTPCPQGGTAHVFGSATSNAEQGATRVELTYVLTECGYLQRDDDPEDNYDLVFDGTVEQRGTLAAQPSATTALIMSSERMAVSGTVYDPPIVYDEPDCPVTMSQQGDRLSGTVCEREAGVDL